MPPSAYIGQIITLLLIGAFSTFFARKLYSRRKHPDYASLVCITIAALLHLASAIYALIRPITLITRGLDIVLLHQSLIFTYYALDQLLNGAQYRPIWKTKLFQAVTPLTGLTLLLDWFQPSNLTSFPDGEAYDATNLYFVSTFLNWAIITSLLALAILPCWKNLRLTSRTPHRVRRIILLLAFIVAAVGLGLITELSLVISYTIGDQYRHYFVLIYQCSRIIAFALVATALTIPMPILAHATQPIELWRHKRLEYLRDKLLAIVPNNELRNDTLRDARVLIEISDASRIIWTHHPNPVDRLSPKQEAAIVWRLLQANIVYQAAGQYSPPAAQVQDVQRYYAAVARSLRRLERYQTAKEAISPLFTLRRRYGDRA